MKPILNLDDPVGKTVGRRFPPTDALEYAFGLQAALNGLRNPRGKSGKCRGVFRFHSHEEADEWMMKSHLQQKANELLALLKERTLSAYAVSLIVMEQCILSWVDSRLSKPVILEPRGCGYFDGNQF